jgi:hypothetical protein
MMSQPESGGISGHTKRKKVPPAESLRNLARGWSDNQASLFIESIKSCERIDEEMWIFLDPQDHSHYTLSPKKRLLIRSGGSEEGLCTR